MFVLYPKRDVLVLIAPGHRLQKLLLVHREAMVIGYYQSVILVCGSLDTRDGVGGPLDLGVMLQVHGHFCGV